MEVSVIARNNATIPLAGNSLTRDSSDDFIGGGIVPVNLLSLYSIIKGEKSHGEAILACRNGGLRPASVSELKDLYKNVAGNVLGEMCTEHGWPLYQQCGGTNSNYWAGDYNSGLFLNEYVNMFDGKEGTTQTNAKMGVVCRDL